MSFPLYTIEVKRTGPPRYERDSSGWGSAPNPGPLREFFVPANAARGAGPQNPRPASPRGGRGRRDPPKRACVPMQKVPVYRVVLKKERIIRVPVLLVDERETAVRVAHTLIGDNAFESLLALLLNGGSEIVGATVLGTTSNLGSTGATIRGVFTAAMLHNAAGIVLAHNHPSGHAAPSSEDIAMTRRAKAAEKILGIPIVDHIIVTRDVQVWAAVVC